ncbi:MAG TPA: D-aminoacylase [Chloroflexota bacterium]
MFDVLITGGQVIDGSGNVGFPAALGVERNTVRILRGDTSALDAARVIDATGLVVCPGFIDFHAHSGLVLLAEPRHEPKIHQGVTTEVIGVDGNSYAPFRSDEDLSRFIQLNSGLDGDPRLPRRWSSVEQYLALFDAQVAVNVCYLVGNSALRIAAVGWNQRPATADEQADMQALLREAMQEGAWGLSTGLDYPPGSYADTAELVGLSAQAARLGGIYHSHVRYRLGDAFLDPFREAIEIGRRSGIAAHITHFYQRLSTRGSASDMLGLLERAREDGLDVTFDSYPYAYSSTRLLIMFPDWIHDGGPERLIQGLRSDEARQRLRQDVRPRGGSWQDIWLTFFKLPRNHVYEGRSVAEIAAMRDQHPVDALCDLLIDEDLRVSYTALSGDASTLPRFLAHPLSMVGSDAVLLGEFPSPRTYGCFPLILGKFARDEGQLSLPQAIRKMTSFPAQRLGLSRRGLLRDGVAADIVVFAPRRVGAPATRTQPKQLPTGIDYVLVNGTLAVDAGQHTGALAGRALRRGRD